ncbi:MAG: hypothetical protein DWQ31_17085 [Planctomycetota bacterium]|nr:MAG: hypothetical protein DWQ31_17085 [Planctomycetota bacterium]REJ92069.1 MAG: hypothetical protein DWQ35_13035 [Planctomycetota bacterium]REK28605.1 MAG: hypothetical protein DWQ42_04625 [Planctomycetota bacterium]
MSLDALVAQKRSPVRWTDEEWDEVAAAAHDKRITHPTKPLSWCVMEGQKEVLPEERRRKHWQQSMVEPIAQRFRRIDKERRKLANDWPSIQQKLQDARHLPTRDKLISDLVDGGLTDEEVLVYFGERVLTQMTPSEVCAEFSPMEILSLIATPELAGCAVQRVVEDLFQREVKLTQRIIQQVVPAGDGQNGRHGKAAERPKPRIVLLGLIPDQIERVSRQFGDLANLTFVNKSRLRDDSIPQRADHVLVWGNFTSKKQKQVVKALCKKRGFADRYEVHLGGFKGLVERIEQLCGSFK